MITFFSPEKVIFHKDVIQNFLNTNKINRIPFVDIDISGVCNCNCFFCNGKRVHNNKFLTLENVKNIVESVQVYDCNSVCLAGGGEPMLNPQFIEIDEYLSSANIEKLLNTNGILLESLVDNMYNYKSIGVSFEATNVQMYKLIRKNGDFWKVLGGLNKLNSIKKQHNIRDTTLKVLITKFNYNSIYDLVWMAKNVGMDNVYLRPAGLVNIHNYDNSIKNLSEYYLSESEVNICLEQIQKSKHLEDDDFHIHFSNQFKSDLTTPKYEFDKCLACLLSLTFCTDGYVYLCIEHRGNAKYRLCRHDELHKVFNSSEHINLINSIDFKKDCPRCARNGINRIIQNCMLTDSCNINFL